MRALFKAVLLVLATGVALVGCSSPPQSTRLTAGDYKYTVSATSQQLSESKFLSERGPKSPRASITIQKVENLTSDVIPESEQWMFILNVRDSQDMINLAQTKNIHFQVPSDRLEKMHRDGWKDATSTWEPPTHLLSAQFSSAMRATRNKEGYIDNRTDQYLLQYTITSIQSGAIEWTGTVEFKRAAGGSAIN